MSCSTSERTSAIRISSRSSLAPARLRTTIRSGSSSITVGGVIQLLGLNPPWSAWTITDPSLLTMISRSASGRTAERRPEYRTSQRATMRRMTGCAAYGRPQT